MYSENRFNFCGPYNHLPWWKGNAAVIPFLESLSKDSRRLVKHIEYFSVVTDLAPGYLGDTENATTEGIFNETCDYLRQNLQLKHVTLHLVEQFASYVMNGTSFKDYLLVLHAKIWEQHLVPLVGSLDTCELTACTADGDRTIDTVQWFLKSKMPQTSKTTLSTRFADNPC